MILGARAVIIAGLIGAILLGAGMAFDTTAAWILGLIFVFGSIGWGVIDKTRRGAISPARCPSCDGLLSPSSPFCKHCGQRLN